MKYSKKNDRMSAVVIMSDPRVHACYFIAEARAVVNGIEGSLYWTLASEQGRSDAQLSLSQFFQYGQGGLKDLPMCVGLAYKAFINQMVPLNPDNKVIARSILDSLVTLTDPGDVSPDLDNVTIDLEDFLSKTKVLSVDMGMAAAQHGGKDFADPDSPLVCKSLEPHYETLAKYGAELNHQAEVVQQNLKTSGFFISCMQPTEELKRNFSPELEGSKREYFYMTKGPSPFSFIGNHNPQLGYDFWGTIKQNTQNAIKVVQILRYGLNISKETLKNSQTCHTPLDESSMTVVLNLPEEQRTPLQNYFGKVSEQHENTKKCLVQIDRELENLSEAKKVVDTLPFYLLDILVKTAPLRDKAFRDENPELFQ